MSNPSWEDMEAKRLQMISSFQNVANAMRQCVTIIEDYARLSPSSLGSTGHPIPTLNGVDSSSIDPALTSTPETGNLTAGGKPKKEKAAKAPKKIKDPNAPKRPPSAYIIYQNAVRDEVKAANPEASYGDILKVISEKWKQISPEEKKIYDTTYQTENAQYLVRDKEYKDRNLENGTVNPSAIQTEAAIHAANAAASDSSSSDSSSSSSSSDSEDEAPVKAPPAPAPTPKVKAPKPVAAPTPAAAPAAATTTPAKKEKKRKQKDEAPSSAIVTPAAGSEKKKKKKKTKE